MIVLLAYDEYLDRQDARILETCGLRSTAECSNSIEHQRKRFASPLCYRQERQQHGQSHQHRETSAWNRYHCKARAVEEVWAAEFRFE